MFQGQSIRVVPLPEAGVFELVFDREGESINKLDDRTVNELRQATQALASEKGLKGVLVSSAKDVFIVGADITEFGSLFANGEAGVVEWTAKAASVFSAFEDLQVVDACLLPDEGYGSAR